MVFPLSLEERKALFRKLSIIGGLIEIFSVGVINSFYSDTRWPTSRGARLLLDFVYVSFSNPYALLGGVLFYLLFQRWSKNIHIIEDGSNKVSLGFTRVDYLHIVVLFIWVYALILGILVY